MYLMNQHICNFTVFDGLYDQKDTSDDHSRKHGGVRLIERVLFDQVVQDENWDREFHVQLNHPPPFGPVIIKQIVTVLQLEYLLVFGRINILGLSCEAIELCVGVDLSQLDRLLLFLGYFIAFGEISDLRVDEL